jgi:radical SAM superfamily enzyme YgiQ (UPF0313 family)
MNIVLATTPIRPEPTDFPPFGSMAVIQSLRAAGYDPYFYDIDCLRPDFDEVVAFFERTRPDVVGISAVVSTAYEYTKRLAQAIRRVSPKTVQVLGGNLAASAEMLHRLCGIDVCVIGEGEKTIVDLVRCLEAHGCIVVPSALRSVQGLTFLDERQEMVFTGYQSAISGKELLDPDWTILERFSNIDNFLRSPLTRESDFSRDERSYQPHRKGQRMATVLTTKGCVARCTFCHRWDKGFRTVPVDKLINHMRYLIARYNIGFFQFGDENFGSDRRHTEELVARVRELDILYEVAGVRVRSVDQGLLERLKKSGCVAVYYGMETGSPKMLEIMEKNTPLDMNIKAARWTNEAGLYTIYQFVIAMPGETLGTINETIEFTKAITEYLPDLPRHYLSINYTQALPGTPVYEYARDVGLIGKTLETEEKYLLQISDTDAGEDTKLINFTDYDYLTVQTWKFLIKLEADAHYYLLRSGGRRPSWMKLGAMIAQSWNIAFLGRPRQAKRIETGGYFNLEALPYSEQLYIRLYEIRHLLIWVYVLIKEFKRLPLSEFLFRVKEWLTAKLRPNESTLRGRSLRKVMRERLLMPMSDSERAMKPLRDGR